MTLTPAYGRDYKSKKQVWSDWEAGKDFVVADLFSGGGKYCNKADVPKGTSITFRYAKLTKVCVVKA
jgi:hypothetical protein